MTGQKFKPGKSGNPRGRPKGTKNKNTLLRYLLEEHTKEILDKAVSMAKRGSAKHQKLILERVLPPLRSTDLPIKLSLTGTLEDKASEILNAVSNAKITPNDANKLMKILLDYSKIMEIDELEQRVNFLENFFNLSEKK